MPRPRPEQPKLELRRGVYCVVFWVKGVRHRFSLGTSDLSAAQRGLVEFIARGGPPKIRASGPKVKHDGVRLYVISSDAGPQKIGVSVSPKARMQGIQGGHPYALKMTRQWLVESVKSEVIEKRVHAMLAEHRMLGEWFNVTPQVACRAVDQAVEDLMFAPKDPERSQLSAGM